MNSDDLLNIINIVIKNEEKLEESPNEIYDLFKKHSYKGDIETLKLDLRNLLDDVIKSDEELSKVAGGKVSKLAAGAVAALTCFPMNSFASGTENTSRNKQSNVNKLEVEDETEEYVIEPEQDAATTKARNPGKSAAVTGALVVYGLLSGLAVTKLASVPKVETQGMTEEERAIVDKTSHVLQELTKKPCAKVDDQEFNWNLSGITDLPKELTGPTIKIGELTGQLMPAIPPSAAPTPAYASARTMLVEFEKTVLNTLMAQHEAFEKEKAEETKALNEENKSLRKKIEDDASQIQHLKAQMKTQSDEKEKRLKEKKESEQCAAQLRDVTKKLQQQLKDQKDALGEQLAKLKEKHTEKEHKLKTEIKATAEEKLQAEKHLQTIIKRHDNLQKLNEALKDANTTLREQVNTLLNQNLDNIKERTNEIKDCAEIIPTSAETPSIKVHVETVLKRQNIGFDALTKAVNEDATKAYHHFREVSAALNPHADKTKFPDSWLDYNGNFSLAEILLKQPTSLPHQLRDGSDLTTMRVDCLNLKTSDYTTKRDLRKAAMKPETWMKWLCPSALVETRQGIGNDKVIAQIPELIIAACTLDRPETLISLLRALETYLAIGYRSVYRQKVNKELAKVGMRFNDNTLKLVSTNQEKK